MRVVDAFRFPTDVADETQLFEWRPQNPAVRKNASEVVHSCFALFDQSERKLAWVGDNEKQDQSWLSLLILDRELGHAQLEKVKRMGFKGVVLHPYLQKIDIQKHTVAVELCREAGRLGLLVLVCTAYGGRAIYDIYPLKIAQKIAAATNTPLVLSHAGGAKVLEAMLLAEAYPNIWLDTSFSLSYWLGSSVERDFAFAMRKLGCERWLFGSDAPFLSQDRALADHLYFFEKHRFSATDIEKVMCANSRQLYSI